MALTVQNDTGTAAGANGYITLAEFKAYHDARGRAYSNDDAVLNAAIVKATDYIDQRFRFRGVKLNAPDQTTQCPRKASKCADTLLKDPDGEDIVGIVVLLKNACAEYSLRATTIPLLQDAPAPVGGIAIDSQTLKVDVIEKSVKFVAGGNTGGFAIPAYPAADYWLARSGLIITGNAPFR